MPGHDYRTLRVTVEDAIATATIHHPPVNVLDEPMFQDLSALLAELTAAGDVRVLVVDSDVPGFFIAHADLRHRPFPGRDGTDGANRYQRLSSLPGWKIWRGRDQPVSTGRAPGRPRSGPAGARARRPR